MERWTEAKSDEYESSVEDALKRLKGPSERLKRNLVAKIENLLELEVADLPKRSEGSIKDLDNKDQKFFAIDYKKRMRIFIVATDNNVLFFSHADIKKKQKLQQSDNSARVERNFRAYQEK